MSSLHIVTLASIGYGQVAVAIFITSKTFATPKLYNNSFILTFALAILSVHVSTRITVKISPRQPPILFRILSRITRVRRRKRASPIQPHTNHTAVHGWPMLLHGHSCHWYLSKLYIYIYKTWFTSLHATLPSRG